MSLFLVRAGRHGEQEQGALDNNVVTMGWNQFSDLSGLKSREELSRLYLEKHPNAKKMAVANEVGQLWKFVHDIKKNDLVALPLKSQPIVAIGIVKGPYQYKKIADGIMHIHEVEWLKMIPRTAIDQDLLYSLGAFMTVCEISRNNAEERIKKLVELKEYSVAKEEEPSAFEEKIDVGEYAKDEIRKFIGRKFVGHNLARLVEAVLYAQGYVAQTSPPGPDGGVDILAAAGALGFNSPRICVQVKSSETPVDVKVLRELQGVMTKVRAETGLLVSWGGFNTKAFQEAKDAFFSIRLWDSDDLLDEIMKHYDNFSDEIKAELPLKRLWGLVLESDIE